jgi:hypothetical protein
MLNIRLPKLLLDYINTNRSSQCRAWYVLHCVKYCYENNLNIYEHYEGVGNEEVKGNDRQGES